MSVTLQLIIPSLVALFVIMIIVARIIKETETKEGI